MRRALQFAAAFNVQRSTLSVLLLCALCASVASAQSPEPITLRITPSQIGLLIPVEVDGAERLLLLDTGALFTHLDAARLRLKRTERKQETLAGAGTKKLAWLAAVDVTLRSAPGAKQHATFNVETLDLDLAALRELCACDVAGVLGLDLLLQFTAAEINFSARTLTLRRPEVKR